MKCFHLRVLRYICFGCLAFLPFTMRAKEIQVTFDAKQYKPGKDWYGFIKALYATLSKHQEDEVAGKNDGKKCSEDNVRFILTVKNGDILGNQPPSNSLPGTAKTRNSLWFMEMFEKISFLHIHCGSFHTDCEKLFPKASEIFLHGTEEINGKDPNRPLTVVLAKDLKGFAKDTPSVTDKWRALVDDICKELADYPKSGNIRFWLCFKNGGIFEYDPGELHYRDYFAGTEKATETTKALSRICVLEVETKNFSTLSLSKIFPWTRSLLLPNTEYITGISRDVDERTEDISQSDYDKIVEIVKKCPRGVSSLEWLCAPKIAEIGNAAFFNFTQLCHINDTRHYGGIELFKKTELPRIVCTPLPQGYFKQTQPPENADVTPLVIKGTMELDDIKRTLRRIPKKKRAVTSGQSVEIGAAAFQRCSSLQHVSMCTSFVGSAAFAASGVKSAHWFFLGDGVVIGNDMFYSCYDLNEFFAVSDSTEDCNEIRGTFDGFFWNCFSLKTVSMRNITPRWMPYRVFSDPFNRGGTYYDSIFANCFSLEYLDFDFSEGWYEGYLPYRSYPIDSRYRRYLYGNARLDVAEYRNSYFASFPMTDENKKTFEKLIKDHVQKGLWSHSIAAYVTSCLGSEIKTSEDLKPLCNLKLITFDEEDFKKRQSCIKKNKDVHYIPYTGFQSRFITKPFVYVPGKNLYNYDENVLKYMGLPFQRFNNAYQRWFRGEGLEIIKKEPPKDQILGKKTKRDNFSQ